MTSRRIFLKTAGAFTLGAFMAPKVLNAAKSQKIGIQLYTVRDDMEKDAKGTIEKIAKMGYTFIETYSGSKGFTWGMKPAEFKTYMKSLGLTAVSSHVDIFNNTEQTIKDAAEAGLKYVIQPWLGDEKRKSIDDYKKLADEFNKIGEMGKKYGVRFGYHNHDFEFEKMNNQIPYDIMLANTDPKLVNFEMDLYWVVRAGYQPLDYFQKYPGRFFLWHVKDMDKEDKDVTTEVGNGSIDFSKIFDNAKLSGMEYFFVEQEHYKAEPIESARTCYNNLSKMI